ncbi:hypothetical protein BDV24DRAFT_129334 [Aspergillus arachidicola]|uniref:Uncharacterized protein n=1 Tax=Aspergillus arachidicola TaxID=656916 RepID=A0A5N6YDG4_9EURO|nr:hypothetical protein BDV24DRAFT_129334 [Aspergillus arachidicola]
MAFSLPHNDDCDVLLVADYNQLPGPPRSGCIVNLVSMDAALSWKLSYPFVGCCLRDRSYFFGCYVSQNRTTNMMLSLADRNAIVTGGSRGICLGTCYHQRCTFSLEDLNMLCILKNAAGTRRNGERSLLMCPSNTRDRPSSSMHLTNAKTRAERDCYGRFSVSRLKCGANNLCQLSNEQWD